MPTVSLSDFIDQRPLSRLQIRIIVLCTIVTLLDGFDAQSIGYVAPALTKALGVQRAALGPIFGAGMAGMMVGALLFGPIADRIGRKTALVICAAVFGAFSLMTATMTDVSGFIVMRFLTGVGLGGATPVAVTLTSEYCPRRLKATLVIIMYCGFSVGSAIGGYVAAELIRHFTWQHVFYVGALPLVLAPLLWMALPESVQFYLARRPDSPRIRQIMEKLAPSSGAASMTFKLESDTSRGLPVIELFREGRTAMTLLVWAMFFLNLVDLFFLFNWLPTVMNDRGIAADQAAQISALMQVGGTLGAILFGRVVDKTANFGLLSFTLLGGAIMIAALGPTNVSMLVTAITVFLVGFFVVGSQTANNAVVALAYPTAIRGTGVSWAIGIGRVGAIVGPLLGGFLLAMHWPTTTLFMIGAVPALIASLCALFFSRIMRKRPTQEVGAVQHA